MNAGISLAERPDLLGATVSPSADAARERVESVLRVHYQFVFRSVRRLGVPASSAEDVTQQVVMVFAQSVKRVQSGKERSFLFGVAMRLTANYLRKSRASREVAFEDDLTATGGSDPGQELEERRARALLDRALAAMPLDQRAVLVMHDIEEMTMAEIANTLAIPPGTVASRLRRARENFAANVEVLRSRGTR